MILHDNASAHKTGAVTQYLSENRITTLPHPAYSPDLAPCDFWLFPKLKELLAGNKYTRVQDLSKAVNAELRSTGQHLINGAEGCNCAYREEESTLRDCKKKNKIGGQILD